MATAEQAAELLKGIVDAGSNRSVVDLGWLDRVRVDPPRAVLRLNLPGFAQGQRDRIVAEARERLLALESIQDVQIEIGTPPPPSQGGIGQAGHGQAAERQPIPGVKQVIAVSSGKEESAKAQWRSISLAHWQNRDSVLAYSMPIFTGLTLRSCLALLIKPLRSVDLVMISR